MKAIDIAREFIARYSDTLEITNLKLNKLVYYTQVESLRCYGEALFCDDIEAWQYGPVVPEVYSVYKRFGRERIPREAAVDLLPKYAEEIVCTVASTYGKLTAFDLVSLSHRTGGAWERVYTPRENRTITLDDIRASKDMGGFSSVGRTVDQIVDSVVASIPNALRMLEIS